jgi:hypothetical protein
MSFPKSGFVTAPAMPAKRAGSKIAAVPKIKNPVLCFMFVYEKLLVN